MMCAMFSTQALRGQQKTDILDNNCSVVEQLPCVMSGGSPFLLNDSPRITGLLLTGPNIHYYHYCGMASLKRMSDSSAVRRRVEQSSLQDSTKAARCAIVFSYLFSFIPSFISRWLKFLRFYRPLLHCLITIFSILLFLKASYFRSACYV